VPGLLLDFLAGRLIPVAQPIDAVTFAPSIKKEQEHLNVGLKTRHFIDFVRALAPTPGGYLLDGDLRVKILKACQHDLLINHPVGHVSIENQSLVLQLHDGRIMIETIQWPGGRPMSGREFANGHQDVAGRLWQ
jgi:methionyl-tRNA formyltransferase